jgi:hypothetical protein
MKKLLLLINGFFLFSQMSFGKTEISCVFPITHGASISGISNILNENPSETFTAKNAAIEKHRVWLNLTNADGAFKQLLVGYIAGATNDWDRLYDGVSLDANLYVDFYSINNGKNLTIQGRSLPFVNTDEVPMGYRTIIEGVFEISISKVDGMLVNQDIFIKDKATGVFHNLKNGAYSFTTLTGTFNDRFVLVYIDKTVVVEPPVVVVPPITTNPLVEAPGVTEPIVTNPIVETPIVTEPIITNPIVEAPIVTEPIVTNPIVEAPVVTEPIVINPIVETPIVTESIVINPIAEAPIVTEPIIINPIVETTIVTEPIVINPIVETPIVTEPIITNPIVEAPIATEPIITNPIVETPIVTEPIITNPIVEAPIVTEPIITNPIVETSIVTEPIITNPIVEAPIVTEPIITNPIAETPIVTEPIITNPLVEALIVTAPIIINPIVSDISKEVVTFDMEIQKEQKEKPVVVSINNYQIKVNSFDENIDRIMVFTLRGRQLYEVAGINSTEFIIQNVDSSHQFLIIKTQLKNGKWFDKKIIF